MDSGFQSLMRFWIPRAKLQIPKLRTPGKKKTFPDSRIWIILNQGKNYMYLQVEISKPPTKKKNPDSVSSNSLNDFVS